jgi:hypothetical protein
MINLARNSKISKLQSLVDEGSDVNSIRVDGKTALIFAAEEGLLEIAQYAVATGAQLDARTNDDSTALMLAVDEGHLAMTQYLVAAGADLQAKNASGKTALIFAAIRGRLAVVQYLVSAGAELEAKTTGFLNGGVTSLMWAAQKGHVAVVQCLVGAGADLEAKTTGFLNDGKTALMLSAMKGHVEQYLVYSGRPWFRSMWQVPSYDAAIAELDQCSRTTVLTSIRANIVSLKDMLLGGGAAALDIAPYPHRIKLLKARICGVVFPEDFTQNLSGIPLPKFNYIAALMRSAKISKLVHGVNYYFFTRIFMLESSISSVLAKSPFTDLVVQRNLLGFILGKAETKALTLELQAISSLTIAPSAVAAASEPGLSSAAKAPPCEKSL